MWVLVLSDALLRKSRRGRNSRERHADVARRFALWRDRDLRTLLAERDRDHAAARSRAHGDRGDDDAERTRAIERALYLLSRCEPSRAANVLKSDGLADLAAPGVIEQLASKHPPRKAQLPSLESYGDCGEPLKIELSEVLCSLRRFAGTGPDGSRNEFWRVLGAASFPASSRASAAVDMVDAFATAYVNARLPAWFYAVWTEVKLIAGVKPSSTAARLDARPIAPGGTLRRAIESSVMASARAPLANHFWPVNVGCAVPGGVTLLTVGFALLVEKRPDLAYLKIDLRNAHNEAMRKAMVQAAYDAGGFIRQLVPFLWASLCPESIIVLGDRARTLAAFRSEEGGQQGSSIASAGFQLALHPTACELDAKLRAADPDACARFISDDGTLAAPLAALPDILDWLEDALATRLGCELQRAKCACYCPDLGARLADDPDFARLGVKLGRFERPDGRRVGHGIDIAGAPLGDDEYVTAYVDHKTNVQISASEKITSALEPRSLQSTHAMTYLCVQPMLDHVIQHVPPSASAAPAARFDAAVMRVADGYAPGVASDVLVRDSAELPARLHGLGLRSRVKLAPAAFVGSLARSLPLFIDRAQNTLPDAAILTSTRGYMPQLEAFFGAGAFDEGNEQLRFDHFVHRSGTRLAREMRDAWAAMQAERPGATDGALAAPAAAIGIDVASGRVHSKFQRVLTAEREAACYADVDARMRRLPARDQRRLAWLSKDVFSQSFVTALPTPECVLPNAEFAEATTAYLGLPSPACSPLAGRTFRGRALDVYGNVLSSTQTKGAHWEDQHDSIARLFVAQANENGLAADYEPTDAFIGVIPRAQRSAFYALRRSTQHSITPDARVQLAPGDDAYYDVKTVHVNGARYPDTNGIDAARGAAVETRARAVPGEYERHARDVDAACCGVPRGAGDGPVLRRLRELGPVRGLVVGAFGEASADVHSLLAMCAGSGSFLRWRGAMARGPAVYRSQLIVQLRRVWGVHFARVNARLKLARVHSAQGRGLPTAAGRGCSHTTRARRDTDANFHAQFGYRSAAHASGRFGG